MMAPLSANSLAKAAHGMCDNLLTCIVRAWDFGAAPLVVGASALMDHSLPEHRFLLSRLHCWLYMHMHARRWRLP